VTQQQVDERSPGLLDRSGDRRKLRLAEVRAEDVVIADPVGRALTGAAASRGDDGVHVGFGVHGYVLAIHGLHQQSQAG
jgi:hypothetical protein